jgi:hypothetical protein
MMHPESQREHVVINHYAELEAVVTQQLYDTGHEFGELSPYSLESSDYLEPALAHHRTDLNKGDTIGPFL